MQGRKRWVPDESFDRFVDESGKRLDGKVWSRGSLDCFGYLNEILTDCRWQRRNGKPLSEKSKTEYGNAILASFTELKELGFGLIKPWNVENGHIESLCRLWATKLLSAATVQNRLTSLSWFGALMSRPGLIRSTHSYDEHFGVVDMCRHQLATRDKSPEGVGMQRDDVIRIAMAEDETFGYMVMLQFALGLRNKEAIKARPLVEDCGDHWNMPPSVAGSKGGRARIIVLEQGTWQREALELVKAFVRRKDKGRLKTPMGWSNGCDVKNARGRMNDGLHYDMNRYKQLLEKCQFTRRSLGFAGHAMRHSFIHQDYEAHDLIASVKVDEHGNSGYLRHADGSPVLKSEREEVKRKQLAVAENLGHARISVTASYYGRSNYAKPAALEVKRPVPPPGDGR